MCLSRALIWLVDPSSVWDKFFSWKLLLTAPHVSAYLQGGKGLH